MLKSKDHWLIIDASGALDLTFAKGSCGGCVANVKSAPLGAPVRGGPTGFAAVQVRFWNVVADEKLVSRVPDNGNFGCLGRLWADSIG